MISKKLLAISTSLMLLLGIYDFNIQTSAKDSSEQIYSENAYYKYGGPVDLSIAREDKVIEMLKKEGKISKDASYEAAHEAFIKYMNAKAKGNQLKSISKQKKNLKAAQSKKLDDYLKSGTTTGTAPTKTVNVLVLLIDYSDFKHNNISPSESDMYYADYSAAHFNDMIFGDNGYTGPKGENLISMKQYYSAQSGGTLLVQGKVAGWYTASNTASYYGGNDPNGNDLRPRDLVKEALAKAAADTTINLANFDTDDRYDSDGDGNYNEPDGIIDHVMVIHAGVGEEAGGGSLGEDAIWSHSWDLGGNYQIPGTSYTAFDYTLEPEDGAAGVFAHEFGHDLGLPDEYDTMYSSSIGEPIAAWSIMSSGSWSGTIPGTEPSGFSPYAKQFFQASYGGNWQKAAILNFDNLTPTGTAVKLKQASDNNLINDEHQVVRINLKDKETRVVTPPTGSLAYWGSKGKDGEKVDASMQTTAPIALPAATRPSLTFSTWYDIEQGWDYGAVRVSTDGTNWTDLRGSITTTAYNADAVVDVTNLITGASRGWVTATFDLGAYAGKSIYLKFTYNTDEAVYGAGFYIDNIKITASKKTLFADDPDTSNAFTFAGFSKSNGVLVTKHYYLVEWRNHHGVDMALAHNAFGGSVFAYDPGMVIWYIDDYYTENWTGVHPGNGFLGIVDADQNNIIWMDGRRGYYADNLFQMKDAAFSKNAQKAFTVNYNTLTTTDKNLTAYTSFTDAANYLNSSLPYVGRNIPHIGLKIDITAQAADNSTATITVINQNPIK
jgi:immune inhibitor A